ncbi:XPB/Ssl2-like helicase family protein [Tamaricihabitans halophyticus]|uniref:XPB/Ssl2-like helicase family protein n=1 Tax=Tamaricihabitans halophyticus TaxID=1262583 RepID=A0A4R2RAX7_9PSEU|nr:helicase-associated domain-containing protein [Tamaricihabitans halophyticus]TCP56575.1 XPB/Ssl2-like helicase family protein [Tamaricihabitans halophyticus]
MSGSSLAEWLRDQDDATLTELLRARQDLATPPPANSTILATRAGTAGSLARACAELHTRELAVLEALLLAEADREPVSEQRVSGYLGREVGTELARLRRLALVWGPDTALAVPPALAEVLGPYPAGLGRSAPALDPDTVAGLLTELAEPERRLLAALSAGPPIGQTKDASEPGSADEARTPVQRLLARGLLLHRDASTVELPREVGIALRGGRPFGNVELDEPRLHTNPHSTTGVDETAAGEAAELLRHVERLIEQWSATPPPVRKAGGVGVRELRKLAKELDVSESRAGLFVELAAGAGLLADSGEATPLWCPTTLADSWLASTPAQRWAVLAEAWLELPRLPGLADRQDQEKPLVPLAEELHRPLAPMGRRRTLVTLAELPAGTGVANTEQLVTLLSWWAPRKGGRLRDQIVRWTVAEGTALGVLALGALTSAGRALLDGDRAGAAQRMAEAMPDPVDHVLVQADLTVIAPGPLEPELAAMINTVAEVESAGSATVYRVGEASVRRALDAGYTAAELHELFRSRSRTPVPQSLSYLIDDVARRHGKLRGGAAASFLRSDDTVLIAEVLAHPTAADLGLRRIADTVVVSPLPLAEVLDGLRAAGFTPAAEGPDGRVVDLRPRGHRVPAKPRTTRRAAAPVTVTEEQATELVGQLRGGDHAQSSRRGRTARLPGGGGGAETADTVALLQEAAREQRSVWIGFVDSHGVASQRIVLPLRVGGGVLEGDDAKGSPGTRFPLHRITSVSLVED